MTLALAALGLALLSEKNINKDAWPPSPDLMLPVDFRKGSGGKGYYPYLMLVDSGTTYNFISQSVADVLRLEAVKAGRAMTRKRHLILSLRSKVNHCILPQLYSRWYGCMIVPERSRAM